ncbi:BQ5605_C004g03112 [Microbotryum silenes-dioicae]|uniref:BQ5605_C004g03112 protein n=1 Tax=Microbotryum silenes-dioicae TaxID=796604 RepID=A0A2X0MWV8_9BASI|nr:BQ5605_C004g03112 [Microbotryum silenes-dioicae]
MVKLQVLIKAFGSYHLQATLENCTDLQAHGDDFNWMFRVQCGSCREEHPNWIGIDATESHEISGSRGEANFVWRCTMCKREHTISKFPFLSPHLWYRLKRVTDQFPTPIAHFNHQTPYCTLADFDPSFNRSKAFYTFDQSESQKFATIAILECRGCEIIKFDPKGIWHCKGVNSGTVFDEVELELSNPDGWTDYDEKASEPVGVSEFESKIERA